MENENERIENPEYKVIWEIDVMASCARSAANEAHRIQRDRASTASVFEVYESGTSNHWTIDTAKVGSGCFNSPSGFDPNRAGTYPAITEDTDPPLSTEGIDRALSLLDDIIENLEMEQDDDRVSTITAIVEARRLLENRKARIKNPQPGSVLDLTDCEASKLSRILKSYFPALGTEEEIDGGDAVEELANLYSALPQID